MSIKPKPETGLATLEWIDVHNELIGGTFKNMFKVRSSRGQQLGLLVFNQNTTWHPWSWVVGAWNDKDHESGHTETMKESIEKLDAVITGRGLIFDADDEGRRHFYASLTKLRDEMHFRAGS